MNNSKTQLIGLDRLEIATTLRAIGVAENNLAMRTQQLWNWIYLRGVDQFAPMTNIARDMRQTFANHFCLTRPAIITEQISRDGTCKWVLQFEGKETNGASAPVQIETVYIPEKKRGTLCISSQVGCTLSCSFCHTGTQRLVRNLTAYEILAQIIIAKQRLNDFAGSDQPASGDVDDQNQTARDAPISITPPESERKITNIVMMGMGEPLYNFAALKKALLIANDSKGLAFSKRRITISTAGVVPKIKACGIEIGTMLAISLHAVRDELRNQLVPLNRKYPISQLLDACRDYPGASNARRITFEYVMLKGINDSRDDAKGLVRLLAGIHAKINLIPYNGWPGSRYQCSEWEQIERFAAVLNRAGYTGLIRSPRGRDIMAACGQLKSATIKIAKSRLLKTS